ncbi:MAG: hypothetical protein AAFN11_06875 [Chloroflexota bacterium]
MKTNITSQKLQDILLSVEPLELEASDALKQQYQQPGAFFPSLEGIDREQVIRMANQVREYTERSWRIANRIADVPSVATETVYIGEFGL